MAEKVGVTFEEYKKECSPYVKALTPAIFLSEWPQFVTIQASKWLDMATNWTVHSVPEKVSGERLAIYFSQKYFGHHFSQIFEEQIHPKKSILLILFLRTNLVEILEGYKWLGPFLHDLMHFMINGYFQNLGHGTSLRECQV